MKKARGQDCRDNFNEPGDFAGDAQNDVSSSNVNGYTEQRIC